MRNEEFSLGFWLRVVIKVGLQLTLLTCSIVALQGGHVGVSSMFAASVGLVTGLLF
jgi:hypothetical protein